jgi:hypothetical protein
VAQPRLVMIEGTRHGQNLVILKVGVISLGGSWKVDCREGEETNMMLEFGTKCGIAFFF